MPSFVPPAPIDETPELAAFLAALPTLAGRLVLDVLGPRCAEYVAALRIQDWKAATALLPKVIAEIDALPKLVELVTSAGHKYLAAPQLVNAKPGALLEGWAKGVDTGVNG